jgi:hypothetical protein
MCNRFLCKFFRVKYQKLAKTLSKIHTACQLSPHAQKDPFVLTPPRDQFIHEFLQTVFKFGDNACTIHFTAGPDRISPWWMDEFVDENMEQLSSISTAA